MTENLPVPAPGDSGEFILYQTEDGQTRIDVRMADETVWLSQKAMADLFQTTKQNVSQHLQATYEEGELRPEATVKKYLTVQTEGNREVSRTVDHDKLDAILAVGYRVRSHRGTQFHFHHRREMNAEARRRKGAERDLFASSRLPASAFPYSPRQSGAVLCLFSFEVKHA